MTDEERGPSIAELQKRAWETADKSGFHEPPPTFGDRIALIHSELSEALEDFRKLGEESFAYRVEYSNETDTFKPEGVGSELADAVIRILDASESYGIPLEHILLLKMEHNDKRPYRHGGKKL